MTSASIPPAAENPSLAVIIPAYNSAQTILGTLRSVLASIRFFKASPLGKNTSVRAVIVDDCSQDNTLEVARSFCQEAPEFQCVRTPANQGAGFARNLGVKMARADLLYYCDADDLYRESHIHTCFQLLKGRPEIGAVKTGVHTEEILHPHFQKVVQTSLPLNLCVRSVCHDFVEGFPEDPDYKHLRGGEDTAYILMLSYFFKIVFTDEKTVQYLRRPGNAFDRQLRKFQNPPGTVPDPETEGEKQLITSLWSQFGQRMERLKKKKTPRLG